MDQKMDRTEFILVCALYLGIAICGLFIAFWSFRYPSADDLVYEECTYICHEDIKRKTGKLCYIYVEEYEKPLEISSITKSYANHDFLSNIQVGDTIHVCIAEEGRLSLFLCYISHKQNVILSHEDYLAGHGKNDRVRIILGWIMFALSAVVLICQIAVYHKYGKIIQVHTRFSPHRPTAKCIAQEIKAILRKIIPTH